PLRWPPSRRPPYPPPPPPYPRPPPPGGLGSRGRASLTVNGRPSTVCPLNFEIAFCASSSELMVTNAKPRDLPVNLSCIRVTSCTVPACAKSSCSSFSVVLKERLPTYNLVPIVEFILRKAARSLFPLIGFQIATE